MKEVFIKTYNYIKMYESFQGLIKLPKKAPKMGIAYGNFGLGKTMSLEKIAEEFGCVLLRAGQTWTKSSLLQDICFELGVDTSGKASTTYKRVIESLFDNPKIIIIDEVDTLLKSQKFEVMELLRDIHDETGIIIYFVGMEESNRKLKKHRHFYSRVVNFIEFEKIKRDDIVKLCANCEIKINDDIIDYFVSRYPNLRQVFVQLVRLEQYAEINDLDMADMSVYKISGAENGNKR